jgi:hypothetical protein
MWQTAVPFELVGVSNGDDLQLLPGESGNVVRLVRQANVVSWLLGARS